MPRSGEGRRHRRRVAAEAAPRARRHRRRDAAPSPRRAEECAHRVRRARAGRDREDGAVPRRARQPRRVGARPPRDALARAKRSAAWSRARASTAARRVGRRSKRSRGIGAGACTCRTIRRSKRMGCSSKRARWSSRSCPPSSGIRAASSRRSRRTTSVKTSRSLGRCRRRSGARSPAAPSRARSPRCSSLHAACIRRRLGMHALALAPIVGAAARSSSSGQTRLRQDRDGGAIDARQRARSDQLGPPRDVARGAGDLEGTVIARAIPDQRADGVRRERRHLRGVPHHRRARGRDQAAPARRPRTTSSASDRLRGARPEARSVSRRGIPTSSRSSITDICRTAPRIS